MVLSELGQESRKVRVESGEAGIEDSFRKDGEREKRSFQGRKCARRERGFKTRGG